MDVVGGGPSSIVTGGEAPTASGGGATTAGKTMISVPKNAILAENGSVIPSRRSRSSRPGEASPAGVGNQVRRSSGWVLRCRRPELEAKSSRANAKNNNNNDQKCCRRSCSTTASLKSTAATAEEAGTVLLSAWKKPFIFLQKGVVPAGKSDNG
ncbi:hypothetical protein Esi_0012_0044 [Ectocarpus siliculosus]|uniref:Uncharacterized protein n=1 Tax=Ectocarpus siliculosus TaxID=2880 RepID=D8LDG2_ECTSI|nr:hypothetical protein Esi_0012_0044 [Ectocarpus siliculosus]|eukprot:CBN74027.1 hypothetical protein Esi_0012_0044 [Ectocarpus siliculosus]